MKVRQKFVKNYMKIYFNKRVVKNCHQHVEIVTLNKSCTIE